MFDMPGAFFKGNSSFPGTTFIVDEISRPWDIYGALTPSVISNQQFLKENNLSFTYYKLQNFIAMSVEGTIVPSTVPYSGSEDDTSFLYSGSFAFPEQQLSTLQFDVGSTLACARYEYQTTLDIIDERGEVFYRPSVDTRLGMMNINGITEPNKLTLSVATGIMPHHTYTLSGVIMYEALS